MHGVAKSVFPSQSAVVLCACTFKVVQPIFLDLNVFEPSSKKNLAESEKKFFVEPQQFFFWFWIVE